MTQSYRRSGGIAVLVLFVGLAVGWILRGIVTPVGAVPSIQFYGDWQLSCPAVGDDKQTCQIDQNVIEQKSGSEIAHLALGRGDKGDTLVVTVPHNVLLPPGLGMQIGEAEPKTYAYRTCNQRGCLAVIQLDDDTLKALRSTPDVKFILTGLDTKTAGFTISFKTFAKAYSAMADAEANRQSVLRRILL